MRACVLISHDDPKGDAERARIVDHFAAFGIEWKPYMSNQYRILFDRSMKIEVLRKSIRSAPLINVARCEQRHWCDTATANKLFQS